VGLFCNHSWSCTVDNPEKGSDKIFISSIHNQMKLFKQVKPLQLRNCKDEIQLAFSIVSPSPQDYSSEYWMGDSINNKQSCEIKSDLGLLKKHSMITNETVFNKYKVFQQCVGLKITDSDGKKIELAKSVNCEQIASLNKNEILLKGDNCTLKTTAGAQNLIVAPVVLETCSGIQDPIDFNANLKVIKIANKAPEILSTKDYHVMFEDIENPLAKIRLKEGMLNFNKSASYKLDFQFFSLLFNGAKDLNLNVRAQYFLNNFSTQNLPFVVKNELVLVKKADKSRLHLGLWYNGIVVPGQWKGVDGLSDSLSINHSTESFELNKNTKAITKGDYLILTAQLASPNSGYQKFWKFTRDYLAKLINVNKKVNSKSVISSRDQLIKPIDELKTLSLVDNIDEFSLEHANKKIFNLDPRFQLNFSYVCQNDSDLECYDFSKIEELPEVKVLFEVMESDFEVQVKPIRLIKKNWNKKIDEEIMNENSSIICH
jgi:hypothetical protein